MRILCIVAVVALGCHGDGEAPPVVRLPPPVGPRAKEPVVLVPNGPTVRQDAPLAPPPLDRRFRGFRDHRDRVLLDPEWARLSLAVSPGDVLPGSGRSGVSLVEGQPPSRPFERVRLAIDGARIEVLFFEVTDVGHVVIALREIAGGRRVVGMLVDPVGRGRRPGRIRRERQGALARLSWSFPSAGRADGAIRKVEMAIDAEHAYLVSAELTTIPGFRTFDPTSAFQHVPATPGARRGHG